MTSTFNPAGLFPRLKKMLLPSLFLLTLSYLLCVLFFPLPEIRFGLVWGFLIGQLNIWAMVWIIGKMLSSKSSRKTAVLGAMLVFKVGLLFALMWAGFRFLGWNLLAMAAGYLQVLFLVVLGLSFGYKPARLKT